MDPIILLLLAKTSYEAVKSAVAAGKEIQGVAKDLGSLFDSVAHITRIAAEPPRASLLSGKTAEQMAMEAYAAKAEADQLMADLKNHFVGEYGLAAWDQVVAATTQIKKNQKAAALQAEKDQDEFMQTVMTWGAALLAIVVTVICLILISIGLVNR